MRWLIVAALLLTGCSSANPTSPSPAPTPAPLPAPQPAPPPPPLPTRGPQFDQTFWNEFVHNTFDAPTGLQPLQRLTTAPMIYLKTKDEVGFDISNHTLDAVEAGFRAVAATWGGGSIGLAGIQRGTGTMEGVSGWITVRWLNPPLPNLLCGRATVGTDGGYIEFNYQHTSAGCGCSGSEIRPQVAKHELGHAFGYWHTDAKTDTMYPTTTTCDADPSAREAYHATLAYQSPVGSTGLLASSASRIVVID